jgi:hypothetical protein
MPGPNEITVKQLKRLIGTPACPVIVFPAYWLAAPPRHMTRRIVRRFQDWIGQEAQAHEARARAFLGRTCHFRDGDGLDLTGLKPSVAEGLADPTRR